MTTDETRVDLRQPRTIGGAATAQRPCCRHTAGDEMLWIAMAAALSGAGANGVDVDQGRLLASIDVDNGGAVEAIMKRTSYAADLRSPERAAVIVMALMRDAYGAPRCQAAAATAIAAADFVVSEAQFTMAAMTCPELLSALWRAAPTPAFLAAATAMVEHIADDNSRTSVDKMGDIELLRGALLTRCESKPDACPLVGEVTKLVAQAALAGDEALRRRVEQLPGSTVVDKVYGGLISDAIDPDELRTYVAKLKDKDLILLAKRARTALLKWCGSAEFGAEAAPKVGRRWVTALQPFDERCSEEGSTIGAACNDRLELRNVGPTCADEQRAFLAKRFKKMKASEAVEVWDTTLLRDEGDRGPQVTLALHYKNKTPLRVIGVLVTVTIKNAFGRVAFTNTFEDEVVVAADSAPRNDRVWVFRDNRFIPNEPYDKLWQMAEDGTATITVSVKKVVFDDGLVLSR